jgi:hypothetical protein
LRRLSKPVVVIGALAAGSAAALKKRAETILYPRMDYRLVRLGSANLRQVESSHPVNPVCKCVHPEKRERAYGGSSISAEV